MAKMRIIHFSHKYINYTSYGGNEFLIKFKKMLLKTSI